VGCGAGLLTVGLAQQGFAVDAIDSSDAMLELATRAVADAGHADAVELRTADVHALPWPDETFSVVVALGVVPWLHAPEAALAEMARVTRRGGHVIVSSDNSLGLSNLLEPRLSAAIAPVRRALTAMLRALRLKGPQAVSERRYTPRRFDRMLAATGLVKLRGTTLGFGRFTFFGRRLLSERRSRALDARLQRAADRPRPIVRMLGNQYLVLTTRP
jgi:ubiquinone/menaquinone biosynthesis C-methylase UbiE